MYHTFFGLTEPAFSIAVNPRYLYMSQQHKEALAHLLYGVAGGGFVMLTGEVGTGKTTIIRCLLEQMPENTDIAIVMNPMSNVPELLTTICEELDASYVKDEPSIKDLTDALHNFLLRNHTRGRNTVLLIDEAQLLSAQALEQVRLLTNLETTTQKLLHIILVGQPELKTLLSKPELRQLAQRITARFHLTPLTLTETQAYIRHRLKIAGLPEGRSPFPFAIIKRIHAFTGGIPRLINVICERCLIGAYGSNKQRVDNLIFNAARKEVIGGLEQTQQAKRSLYWKIAASVVSIGLVTATFYFTQITNTHETKKIIATQNSSATSVASSAASSSAPSMVIRNYHAAEDTFFNYLGVPIAVETRPCGKNLKASQQCIKAALHTWTDVSELNRPAILVMSTPEKFSTYLVLIGLTTENALVLNEQQKRIAIPLAQIGRDWTGELIYLWKKPPAFTETLLLGDSSPTVAWLAQQFAKIDNQKDPLTDDLFSLALQERIKIFQRSRGISADGNINEQTLMKINEVTGADKTLLTDFKEPTEHVSLLLDALNKADQERKRNEATPGINSNHEHRDDHGPRNHSILLIVAIAIGLLILLAAIYWLGQRSTVTPVATAPVSVNAASSSPKATTNKVNQNPVANNDVKPNEPKQENGDETPEESVANLYQNTQVPASNAAITISTPPAPVEPVQPINEPAPVSPQNVAIPTSITQFANLPEIHDLPNNILEKIPSLGYSEHNYNENGGSVKINGEIKHVNDQLGNGIVIDKILEDGMILHIDNYSFKMRAMNSWVNM